MAKTQVQTKAQDKKQAEAAKAETPQAPRYVVGPWPQKAQSGNSIRAYCYSVAKNLEKSSGGKGFTAAELASAFAEQSKDTTYKQPSAGWGTKDKPNSTALSHANWFAHPKQGWLTDVEVVKEQRQKAKADAEAKKQAAPAKAE